MGRLTAELHASPTPRNLPTDVDFYGDAPAAWGAAVEAAERALEDPEIARPRCRLDTLRDLLALLATRGELVEPLRGRPVALCHGDSGRRNLRRDLSRAGERFHLQRAEAQLGSVELHLAAFVNGTLITESLEPTVAVGSHAAAETAFAEALTDAGRGPHVGAPVSGYRMHATLRRASSVHGVAALVDPSRRASSRHWGEPFEQLVERRAALTELMLVRAAAV